MSPWMTGGPNDLAPVVEHDYALVPGPRGTLHGECDCGWTGEDRITDTGAYLDIQAHLDTARWGHAMNLHGKWPEDFDEMFDRTQRRAWRGARVFLVLYALLALAVIAAICAGIVWLVSQ